MEIKISSQGDYDKLVETGLHKGNHVILEDTRDYINVKTNVTVGAGGMCKKEKTKENIEIIVEGNGVVEAEGLADIYAYGDSKVKGTDCNIFAYDNAHTTGFGSSCIYAGQKATAIGYGTTWIEGNSYSTIEGNEGSKLSVKDHCIATANGFCSVESYDKSIVILGKKAMLHSHDNSLILTHGAGEVKFKKDCYVLNLDLMNGDNFESYLKKMSENETFKDRPLKALKCILKNITQEREQEINDVLRKKSVAKDKKAFEKYINEMMKDGAYSGRKSNAEKNGFELKVTKDGEPRKLKLENDGGKQYSLYIVYPDGQQVRAKIQPEKSGMPNIKFLAEKNGFEYKKETGYYSGRKKEEIGYER